ncbi:MAG: trigger factor [bacterium]
MDIVVNSPKPYTREIEITYPADEVREKYTVLLNEIASNAQVAGFRKGKVPKAIIIKNYGEAIREDLAEELIKQAYTEALEKHDLAPLVPPRVEEEIDLDPEKDFAVTLKVEVKPEVVLNEYKGLELRKKVEPVADEEIDKTVEELQNRGGMLKPVEDRPAQAGDLVLVDFKPEGEETPSKRVFKLDESATVVLIGKNAGDKVEGHFEFPDDWPDRELAGAVYDAEVDILELKELIPAEIDEEFLNQFGEEVKSEEDLRGKIREELEQAKKFEAEDEMRRNARELLIDNNPIEHSPLVVQAALEDTIKRYWDMSNLEGEQLTEIREKLEPKVIRDMTGNYILDEIAETEKIEVTRDEIKERIAEIARANNIDPDAYYRYLRKEGNIDSIEADIKASKAMDLVIENATIIEE